MNYPIQRPTALIANVVNRVHATMLTQAQYQHNDHSCICISFKPYDRTFERWLTGFDTPGENCFATIDYTFQSNFVLNEEGRTESGHIVNYRTLAQMRIAACRLSVITHDAYNSAPQSIPDPDRPDTKLTITPSDGYNPTLGAICIELHSHEEGIIGDICVAVTGSTYPEDDAACAERAIAPIVDFFTSRNIFCAQGPKILSPSEYPAT